jgi:hypothetical protein
MRSHPTYAAFERRWQLFVYFQLRWKEIVGKLEDTLNIAPRGSIGTLLTLLKSTIDLMWMLSQMSTLNKAHPKHKVLSRLFVLVGVTTST